MKTIGLIGGMSWESSMLYYEYINKEINQQLGGFHSSKCILNSVDFAEIYKLQIADDWDALNKLMVSAGKQLENAGADIILICANTMHLCYEELVNNTEIPILHIANATAEVIKDRSLSKVALLGTKFTMERDFYKKILSSNFGIETIIPNQNDRNLIHSVIYDELVHGVIRPESKREYLKIIDNLIDNGAEGVILGCTEIPLLIDDKDVKIPIFNTTKIHVEKAIECILK